jgi:hypothetical protein
MTRRDLLAAACAGTASLIAPQCLSGADAPPGSGQETGESAYRYRIAFGAWINDMRRRPLPLDNWPAPQFDDETVESVIRAMDVQAEAGFNYLDAWGLFATYGWPPDIISAVDDARRVRLQRLATAARERNIRLALGLGTYSWGYDKIIEADPAVRGKNPDGTPHAHALCDANPKSFEYVTRIIDFTLGQLDFGAVHLESCDLGCCWCPECAGKDGVVAYNVRINTKTADYIKQHWPDKIVYVITINWIPAGTHFSDQELARVFDQGHTGYFSQWSDDLFRKVWVIGKPGEFKLDQHLFGTSPGPATFLKEPCLDAQGRKEYRKGLAAILTELPKLEGQCDDGGRLANIERSVIVTLNLLNTVCYCLGEPLG